MKVLFLLVVIGTVLGVGYLMKPQVIEVTNQEPEVKIEEVQVDALEQAIKEAQEAKRADIESVAKKAYDDAHAQEMRKIELEVVKSFNDKLEARQIELEKQTGDY